MENSRLRGQLGFEESDTILSLQGDGRRIRIERDDIATFNVEYDRSYETPEGHELLVALKHLSPESGARVQVKKSIEPISTLQLRCTSADSLLPVH